MFILQNAKHQNQVDIGVAVIPTDEIYSRIYLLNKMMFNERFCRVIMVTQQPNNWATIQQSTFTHLRAVCFACVQFLDGELTRRAEKQQTRNTAL